MKHAKSLIPAILAVSVMTGAPALMTEPAYAAEASQSAVAEQQPVAANNGVHTFLSNVDAIDHEIAALKDFQKKDSTALTEKDQNAANQKLTYLHKVKELVYESKDKADFIQNVKAAFPNYAGENDLEMTAAALFPKKQEAPIPDTGSAQDIAAIKKVIDQYADSITNYDLKEAERIWQTDDRTTFIHPRGNEYGWKAIRDHFYGTTMHEHFSKRHLYVRDIIIQVYGDSAVAVFYWDFPAVFRTDGTEVTTHGRETQVYERTKDGWKIVHVHYSQMPITGEKQGF